MIPQWTSDQIWTWLQILLRLLLAVACGGVIGMERGRKGRPAGFRTHVLVCLGSALTVMTNEFIFQKYGTGDPTRMAAQVVSGIGFLGAGTILVTGRRKIRGLTTAATLWASGCLGLAIGVGFYVSSLAGTALIWGVNTLLQRVEEPFMDSARVILVYLELQDITAVRHVLDFARKRNIRVSDIELMKDEAESSLIGMTASLRLTKAMDHQILHEELENVEGVDFLEFM